MTTSYDWKTTKINLKDGKAISTIKSSGSETTFKTVATNTVTAGTDGYLLRTHVKNNGDSTILLETLDDNDNILTSQNADPDKQGALPWLMTFTYYEETVKVAIAAGD